MGVDDIKSSFIHYYGARLVAAYESFRSKPPPWDAMELHNRHFRALLLAVSPECFDDCRTEEFTSCEWMTVLLLQPQLKDRLNDDDLGKLDGYDWMRLIFNRPEFASDELWKRLADGDDDIWSGSDMKWFREVWNWYAKNDAVFARYRPSSPIRIEENRVHGEIGILVPSGYSFSFKDSSVHPGTIADEMKEIEDERNYDPDAIGEELRAFFLG